MIDEVTMRHLIDLRLGDQAISDLVKQQQARILPSPAMQAKLQALIRGQVRPWEPQIFAEAVASEPDTHDEWRELNE